MRYRNIKQRISEKDKYAHDVQWGKDVMDMFIPTYNGKSAFYLDYKTDLSNYRLMNNILDQEEFARFCNPLGINVDQYTEEVMPYNKTPNKINVLLGEELKRGENFKPILLNQSALYRKDQERIEKYKEYINSEIEKVLIKVQTQLQGMSEEEQQKAIQQIESNITPEGLEETSFLSELEILGSQILDYARYDQEIKSKKNDAFKHALLSDKEFIYVGIEKGKPVIKNLNSLHVFYQKSPEVKFIQDGDWAGHRVPMTVSRVLDLYGDMMTEKDIDWLENRFGGKTTNTGKKKDEIYTDWRDSQGSQNVRKGYYYNDENRAIGSYGGRENNRSNFYNSLVWVTHVEWRSQRRVGFISYYNEYGEMIKDIVDEKFIIPDYADKVKFRNNFGNQDIKWMWEDENGRVMEISYAWIPRIWEGTRIDDEIYVNIREKPNQVTSIDDPFHRTKLGYYGLIYNNMNAKSISAMSRMRPFQFLLFAVMHQFTELLSRNYGKLIEYDLAQVPQELGRDGKDPLEMLLYYQRKGYSFYNSMENSEGGNMPANRGAATGVSDLSTTQDLINLANIADWLDEQIGNAAGITKQREGNVSPNTNVTDNRQAITQSSHITEIYFHLHNELWKHVMEGYLTTFKIWARNFLKSNSDRKEYILSYILPDEGKATLRISSDKLQDVDYGIFMSYSGQEQDYLNKLENLLQPLIQNQASGATEISYILKARAQGTSPEEIHKMIKNLDIQRKRHEEQMQQAQLKNQEKLQKMQIDAREDEQRHELDKIILAEQEKRKTLEVEGRIKATIEAMSYAEDKDMDKDGMPDVLEVAKHGLDANIQLSKAQLERDKFEFEKQKTKKDQELKEKEIKIKSKQKNSSSK